MFKPKEIKKRIRTPLVFIALILISLTILQFCGKEKDTVLVSSGTYTGIVTDAVEPAREFYLKLNDDSLVRLNFIGETTLKKNEDYLTETSLSQEKK